MQIHLTGRMCVEHGDLVVDAARFRGRQARLAFAYLAVHREPVSRDVLAEMLWGERLPTSWERDLSAVISRVRSVLAPVWPDDLEVVSSAYECYELRLPDDGGVDVDHALASLDEAEAALGSGNLATALGAASVAANLARRPFLPGEDAAWIERVRERLRSVLVRALEIEATAFAARGGYAAAVEAAAEAVRLEPFRESGYVRLMRLHLSTGNRAEALRTYERCRVLLADELGVAPSEETQAAYAEALGIAPQLPTTPPKLIQRERSPLVGRDDELHRLLTAERPLVLVSGEPGVGKTRLLLELARRANERGASVVYGRCDEQVRAPYQPFVEMLRQWLDVGSDDPIELLLPSAREPALRLVDDAASERIRLFDAVAAAFARGAGPGGVLVLVDDLQWADHGTLLLVRHLARQPEGAGQRIVATVRDSEPTSLRSVIDVLGDLRGDDLLERIELGGLDVDDVDALLLAAEPGGSLAGLAPTVHRVTGGNPFFVRELGRQLLATAPAERTRLADDGLVAVVGLPEGVRDVLERRIARLPAATSEMLAVAAVVGEEFMLGVVARATGVDDDTALRHLEAATAARLVSEHGGIDRFRFAHALVRDAVDASLSSSRRARLHARIAEALEEAGASPSELAHHYLAAGEHAPAGCALAAAERAGQEAMARFAYEEAAAFYTRGAAAAVGDERARARLLVALGDARCRAGDVPAARTALGEAADLARAHGHDDVLVAAAAAYGDVPLDDGLEGGAVSAVLVSLLEEALAVAPEDAFATRARLEGRLAMELHFSGEPDRRRTLTRSADDLARRSHDEQAMLAALLARYYDLLGSPDVDERLSVADDLVALSRRVGPTPQLERWRIRDLLELGRVSEADAAIDEYEHRAWRFRRGTHAYNAAIYRAMRATMEGRFADGERLALEAHELGMRVRGPAAVTALLGAQLFALRLLQGRVGELIPMMSSFAELSPHRPVWRTAVAFAHAEVGDSAAAEHWLAPLADDAFASIPHDSDRPVALALSAWAAGALGDAAASAALQRLLSPYERLCIVVGVSPAVCAGSAADPLAVAAAAAGDRAEAARFLAYAESENERLGAWPWLDRTRARSSVADPGPRRRRETAPGHLP